MLFTGLLFLLEGAPAERDVGGPHHVTVWLCGISFGMLHATNVLAGVPVELVAVQTVNAAVWGVAYGYARAMTASLYPPIVLQGR